MIDIKLNVLSKYRREQIFYHMKVMLLSLSDVVNLQELFPKQ